MDVHERRYINGRQILKSVSETEFMKLRLVTGFDGGTL